jgi:large subunit ribosomal protein L23
MAKEANKTEKIAYKILVEPWITEESTRIAQENKYIFKVSADADKNEVKRAIEEVYGVKVISVNTVTIPAKKRTRGRKIGWKSGHKKAIVTVKEGDKIELFEGK